VSSVQTVAKGYPMRKTLVLITLLSMPALDASAQVVKETVGRYQKDAGASTQDAQARQLLTSSAWCSFTYNKVSGTSTTRKVVFRPDGMMTINGGAETYSSGHGGTVAGQSRSQGAMRWKMENLRLYVDQGGGSGFQDVGLDATRNSSGSIILHADGREYAMCN
jgi:hypothetical protein